MKRDIMEKMHKNQMDLLEAKKAADVDTFKQKLAILKELDLDKDTYQQALLKMLDK